MEELEQPSRPFLAQPLMGAVESALYFAVGRLLFILAELLYTLRLVDRGGRILAEPFLFIGLIAIVRRVLVVVAEVEHRRSRTGIEDFVLEMAGLGLLALVLMASIYLLRRSAAVAGGQPRAA
jgi:hypothetical protein